MAACKEVVMRDDHILRRVTQDAQLAGHALEDVGPIAQPAVWRNNRMVGYQGLSSRSNIQRQSGAMRQRHPDAYAQRAGQVSDGRVGRDHEVQMLHHGGRVEECRVAIEVVAQIDDRELARQAADLIDARPFLQTDQPHAGHAGQRRKRRKRDRAQTIAAKVSAVLARRCRP